MSDEPDGVENWQERAEQAEAALDRVRTEAAARIMRAELKTEAVKAGMIDLDGLKLIDIDDVRMNEAGEVQEAAALLARLKRAKPWLFGAGSFSSAAAHPPRAAQPRARHANELSHEEWLQARAALLRRR